MRCEEARQRIPQYVSSELTDEEMAAMDEHLDQCNACVKAVDNYLDLLGLYYYDTKKNELLRLMNIPMPSPEQVQKGIEAVLRSIQKMEAKVTQKTVLTAETRKPKVTSQIKRLSALDKGFVMRWVYGLTVIAVMVLVIFVWHEYTQRKVLEQQIASLQTQITTLKEQNEALKQENKSLQQKLEKALQEHQRTQRLLAERQKQRVTETAQPAFIVVRDKTGIVSINADGTVRLSGQKPLLSPFDQWVREFVKTGTVKPTKPVQLALAILSSEAMLHRLRSAQNEEEMNKPVLLSPVLTAVRSLRPTLRWESVPKAQEYKVRVVDKDDKIVWEGSAGAETNLTLPEGVLCRGQVYIWQVEAVTEERSFLSPAIGFWVLSEKELREVRQAEQKVKGSALALASLYTRYGLYEEALAQLNDLAKMNPKNPFVQGLLHTLSRQTGREK